MKTETIIIKGKCRIKGFEIAVTIKMRKNWKKAGASSRRKRYH